MNIKYKNICLFLFILVVFLGLTAVSAQNQDDSEDIQDKIVDADINKVNYENTNQNIIKDTTNVVNEVSQLDEAKDIQTTVDVSKQSPKNIKTASKTPVTYNIIVRNNLVDNTTFDVAVINANNNKAIAGSNLKIRLPDDTVLNTKTNSTGYSRVSVNLPSGNNTVNIDYAGNATYQSYNYDLVLEIFKSNVNMSVAIIKEDIGRANISVNLKDANTINPISNANIGVRISDGRVVSMKTDKNGNGFISIDLNAGDNFVNITFDGKCDKQFSSPL